MKRQAWLAIGLLAVLVVLSAGLRTIGQQQGATSGPAYSTRTERKDDGLYFLYRAAGAAGYSVTEFTRDPSFLDGQIDLLVMWYPDEVTNEDWQHVQHWVEQGGVVVVSLPYGAAPSAISIPQSEFTINGETVHHTHPGPLATAAPNPDLWPGSPLQPPTDRSTITYIVDDAGGPQLVGWSVGKGQVYQVANPRWFSGDFLAQKPDNLALALALLAPRHGGQVAFDEYHHGQQAATSWWQILRPNLTLGFLELLAALALAMWAVGGRLGRPIVIPRHELRESHEYVTALAGLLRQARGGGHSLAYTRRRVVSLLRRRLGVTAEAGDDELARRYALQSGREPTEVAALLHRTAQNRALSDKELLQETATLQQLIHPLQAGKAAAGRGARR